MLESLTVKNFAIIDNISIDFKEGFTAITGETGAGKSLLIDAIGLLLGDRASTSMVRNGCTKAIIEGVFTNIGTKTLEILEELGLNDDLEEDLIIKKEININGKSTVRINGFTISNSELERIAETLADIHTQNDTKKLFNPKNYLNFIDDKDSRVILKEYQESRNQFIQKHQEFEKISQNINEFQKEVDYLKYQLEVLQQADLKDNELEDLEEELNSLNNYEQIFKNLSQINQLFYNNNITDNLYEILENLNKTANLDSKFHNQAETLRNNYYDIVDLENELSRYLEHFDFDEDHFNEVNGRINYLHDLMRKYKKSVPELIAYRNELEKKLNVLDDQDYLLANLEKECKELFDKTKEIAQKLTLKRKGNAKKLTESIKESLKDLMLDKVKLEIRFSNRLDNLKMSSNAFVKNGCDDVEILISFNPGEPLKELSKVASGGEMSRVMLAIKTHMMSNMQLATMIFDEIDSGVSGEVALEVAKKLKEISKFTQVLAITHLPIVASKANHQLFITKKVENDITSTSVVELNYDERVDMLAKMISPNDFSGKSKELAISMLNYE